jgi:hypothetical protein
MSTTTSIHVYVHVYMFFSAAPATHLRLVTSAESVKQAKMAAVDMAAVMRMAGLTARAASIRGPRDVPWANAKAPSRP